MGARTMFAWFTRLPAYTADFVATRELAGDPLTLRDWVQRRAAQPTT